MRITARNPPDREVEGQAGLCNQVIWRTSFYIAVHPYSKIFFIRKSPSMVRDAREAEGCVKLRLKEKARTEAAHHPTSCSSHSKCLKVRSFLR